MGSWLRNFTYARHVKRGTLYRLKPNEGTFFTDVELDVQHDMAKLYLVGTQEIRTGRSLTTYSYLTTDWIPSRSCIGNLQIGSPVLKGTEIVDYKSLDDGQVWLRPISEFLDGRFDLVRRDDMTKEERDKYWDRLI